MKRMKFAALALMAIVGATAAAPDANAWCVYNKSSDRVRAYASLPGKSGHTWLEEIDPGDAKCCHYTDSGCNPSKKRDSVLDFDIYKARTETCNPVSWLIGDCPAFDGSKYCHGQFNGGGYVIIKDGAGTKYDCGAYLDP
ncbi:hypothetical protein ACM64Y_00725 [Novispirillum sp. DQ9]|uniref:hypothetical protein n=1 Tax=Novispirillum sp. DQ9 TaxID=3398612 RepID=UPI003C7B00DE